MIPITHHVRRAVTTFRRSIWHGTTTLLTSALLWAITALSGCGLRYEPAPRQLPAPPAPAAPTPPTASSNHRAPAAELPTLDDAGLRALVDAQRGQVVLVDFWATWCGPCKDGFADLQAWRRRYGPQGLQIVTVSLDDVLDPETRTAVQEFLQQHGTGLAHYVSRFGGQDRSFEAFEIDPSALPHWQLFDRGGQRVRKFASGDPQAQPFTHDDVEQAIQAALAGTASAAAAAQAPPATPGATP